MADRIPKLLSRCLFGTLVMAASCVHAAVLDFEELPCPRTQPVCHVGNSYHAKGYSLSYSPATDDTHPVGLQVVGRLWAHDVGGSVAMLANSCNATTTLRTDSGRPFAVLAMDLAEANGDAPASVVFSGRKVDGSVVNWTIVLDGRPGWQRVVLPPRFYNLVSLRWLQGDCVDNKSHMFDNILVMPGIAPR